jgi:hypothetical protein
VTVTDAHRDALRALAPGERPRYLLAHSGLPGPRANLELVQAAADVGSADDFGAWLAADDEYLAVCGAVGLGRLLAEGDDRQLRALRLLAADPRWRVREGVAMALQRLGDADPGRLTEVAQDWASGSAFEQRAAVAGICEPRLLKTQRMAAGAVRLVDVVTKSFASSTDRHDDGARALRKALGYCWSVALAAAYPDGRDAFERWVASDDPDVRWIVRTNLGKSRLVRLDKAWVADCAARAR